MTTKLPELPEPALANANWIGGDIDYYYTADQLRAYGDEREAYGRATPPMEVAVGKWAIEVEKRLCAMLGRQWSPGNISIESLCDELDATRPAPGRDGVDWKAMYRVQTAMRHMDNNALLTLAEANAIADEAIRGLEAAPRSDG